MTSSIKPSSSGVCVGTVQNNRISFLIRLTELFNEDNYQAIVILNTTIEEGASSLPSELLRIRIPASTYGNDEYYFSFSTLDSEIPDYYKGTGDKYTMYFYAQAANGKYYAIKEGNPVQFWTSTPSIETYYDNGEYGLYIDELEQEFSSQNYNAIVISQNEVDNETGKPPSPYYQYADFTDERYVEITSSFFDEGTYYVYKRTKFDDYYLLGEAEFEPSEEPEVDISDCKIEYEVIERKYYDSDVSGVEAYVDNYIDITLASWKRFCGAINAAREIAGLSLVTFTAGSTLSALMWNEAMEAFAEVSDELMSYFDAEKFSVSKGDPITKELIDQVNADISAVLEEITT